MSPTATTVPLTDLVLPVSTWQPERDAPNGQFQYIDISSIDAETKTIIYKPPIPTEAAPSRARQRVFTNDVLVSTVRPNLNGVAIVPDDLHDATASTGFCVLRPDAKRLHSRYLFQWVKSPQFVSLMTKLATGQSYPAVSDRIVLESKIPVPPLAEQKRIAAILDAADALRAKRRAALTKLDQLAQSIFIEMFGDAQKRESLSDVCDLITDGTHYTPTYAENGVMFLSAKNVTSGRIDWSNIKYIPLTLHEELQKRVAPRLNDVLLAKNGTTGVAAIVDREIIFDIYVSLALLRAGPKLRPRYLLHSLNSIDASKQFKGALKGIGVPNLHLVDIRRATIPCPTLEVQDAFIKKIEVVDNVQRRAQAHLKGIGKTFASLQYRAFKGEL